MMKAAEGRRLISSYLSKGEALDDESRRRAALNHFLSEQGRSP
jgi:hypothetical protein